MATVAAGSISKAEEYLRTMLADCDAFRTWSGAANQAKALARIHVMGLPPPENGDVHTLVELQTYRPYVIVWTNETEGFSLEADAGGDRFHFAEGGTLMLELNQDVPEEITNNRREIYRRFMNSIGQILDDLQQLAGTAGYLTVRRMVVVDGPNRSDRKSWSKQGDYVDVRIRLEWGRGG